MFITRPFSGAATSTTTLSVSISTMASCALTSGDDMEAGKSSPKEPASVADKQDVIKEQNRLSPAVRQRVLEHNIDISRVQGSGRDGRITLHDVENLVFRETTW